MRPAFALTHRLSTLTALTAVCLACVTAAHSQSITIGAPGDPGNGNAFPFGNTFGGVGFTSRYQQVYNKSLFSTPIAINQITFFHTNNNIGGPGGVGIQPATYTIHLSTTGKPVNGLDASNFNANVGADDAFFFSANLGGAIGPELSFNGPAFHYDPSAGNLLLDITKVDISDPLVDIFLDAHAGTFGSDSSRAGTFSTTSNISYGLVTRFSFQPTSTPEPGSMVLLAGILVAGTGLARRRRMA